jgi:hypothetical protein
MATMVRRPPARFFLYDEPEGLSGRVSGATGGSVVDQAKVYGGAKGGSVAHDLPVFAHVTSDFIQLNPAHEQPRLIFNSGAQPIIRWGFRRFVRTFMTAGPRFYGRWFYSGLQMNQFVQRGRVTGIPGRLGTSYYTPRFQSGPRVVVLGGPRK